MSDSNIELPSNKGATATPTSASISLLFTRKVCLVKYSMGFIFMPGGFGTLDELFEVVTLVQTQRVPAFPIILFGKAYWSGLLDWVRATPRAVPFDFTRRRDLLRVTDDLRKRWAGFWSIAERGRPLTRCRPPFAEVPTQ